MKNKNKNKPWSEKEVIKLNKLLILYPTDIDYISNHLGRTPGAIKSKIKRLFKGAAGNTPYGDLMTNLIIATRSLVHPTKTQGTYWVNYRNKSYILSLFVKIFNPLTDFDIWETLYDNEWRTFFKFPSNIDFNYAEKQGQVDMKNPHPLNYVNFPDDYPPGSELEMDAYEWEGTKKEFEEFMLNR